MSNQRRVKRRLKQRPFQMPSIDPMARVVELKVTYADGTQNTKHVSLFSLEQTLVQLHRRGYVIEGEGRALVARFPRLPKEIAESSEVKEGAAAQRVEVEKLIPQPEPTTPEPEPEEERDEDMAKKRVINHAFEKGRRITNQERLQFARLFDTLIESGWTPTTISVNACGYSSIDAAKRVRDSVRADGKGEGGSFNALRGLRWAVASMVVEQNQGKRPGTLPAIPKDVAKEVEREVLQQTDKVVVQGDTVTVTHDGKAPEMEPGTVIAAGETVSIPWMEHYQASVDTLRAALFDLIDAVAEVPEMFRGKQMIDLRDSLVRALEEHDR